MRLLCWNINSLAPTVRNAVLKYSSWRGFFDAHQLDVLCLQEAKVPEDKLTKELVVVEGFESYWAFSRERKGYSGVVTYCSSTTASPLAAESDSLGGGEEDIDREGRVVITDLGAFVLINVYVPNAGDRDAARPRLHFKLRFLQALRHRADMYKEQRREVLIVGDFNIAAAREDVHPSISLYGDEERSALQSVLNDYTDVWRHLHPGVTGVYTVWDEKTSARAFNQGVRIDYVLCTPSLLQRVVSCEVLGAEVLPPKWSDHAGILLELRDVPPPPAHPPCQQWTRLLKRFHDSSQRSILSMFKKRPAAGAGQGKQPAAGGPSHGASPEPSSANLAEEAAGVAAGAEQQGGQAGTAGPAQLESREQQEGKAGMAEGGDGRAKRQCVEGASGQAEDVTPAALQQQLQQEEVEGTEQHEQVDGKQEQMRSDAGAGSNKRSSAGGSKGWPPKAGSKQQQAADGQRSIASFFGGSPS